MPPDASLYDNTLSTRAVARTYLPKHSKAQRALGRFVGGPFDDDDGRGGPGGWWIFVEVDVALSVHDIVRPDLAGWRRERLADRLNWALKCLSAWISTPSRR